MTLQTYWQAAQFLIAFVLFLNVWVVLLKRFRFEHVQLSVQTSQFTLQKQQRNVTKACLIKLKKKHKIFQTLISSGCMSLRLISPISCSLVVFPLVSVCTAWTLFELSELNAGSLASAVDKRELRLYSSEFDLIKKQIFTKNEKYLRISKKIKYKRCEWLTLVINKKKIIKVTVVWQRRKYNTKIVSGCIEV